jgi:hypothetical protein
MGGALARRWQEEDRGGVLEPCASARARPDRPVSCGVTPPHQRGEDHPVSCRATPLDVEGRSFCSSPLLDKEGRSEARGGLTTRRGVARQGEVAPPWLPPAGVTSRKKDFFVFPWRGAGGTSKKAPTHLRATLCFAPGTGPGGVARTAPAVTRSCDAHGRNQPVKHATNGAMLAVLCPLDCWRCRLRAAQG